MEFLLYILIGAVISVLSGFFGVGGGFILTPFLLLIGFSPVQAIVTSLFYTIGTSAMGILAHIRLKNILWREGLIIGLSGVVATQFTKPFVLALEEAGWSETVIPVLYIILLSYFMIRLFKQGSSKEVANEEVTRPSYWKLLFVGLAGGVISAALGVGGGFVIVPLLIAVLNFEPRRAVGTSLLAVLIIATAGFISYAVTVTPNFLIALSLVAGALFGSRLGAKLTVSFQARKINIWLAFLYLATMISVVLKLLRWKTAGLFVLAAFAVIFFIAAAFQIRNKKEERKEIAG